MTTLLTTAEVAAAYRVTPITVYRWARGGRLESIKTPGGHRRYRIAEATKLRRDTDAGYCPECSYPFTAPGHETECEGKP